MPDEILARGIIHGALVYGALYTAGLFAAGLAYNLRPVVFGSIAMAGITYMSFMVQIMGGPIWMISLTLYLPVIIGAATGIVLLFYFWPS